MGEAELATMPCAAQELDAVTPARALFSFANARISKEEIPHQGELARTITVALAGHAP